MRRRPLLMLLAVLASPCANALAQDRPDVVFADFEKADYGDWATTGTAFGNGPAEGTLPNQMKVDGFDGARLVNSYHGGDASTGMLTSPKFTIDRKYIAFKIGGGAFTGQTCVNLLVADDNLRATVVRTATGSNIEPGGSEALRQSGWDVSDLIGKTAQLRVVDRATGGWGHITLDQVVFTDRKPAGLIMTDAAREIASTHSTLLLPVKNGGTKRTVTVSVDGQPQRQFTIECGDSDNADWYAPLDVSQWSGKSIRVSVDQLPESSTFLSAIRETDSAEQALDEADRPKFHFTAARGWINDPNGLVYFNGEYHLFYQHNPYGVEWGKMHWGHAVSKDLVRWTHLSEALYPDASGTMYSGSAAVDWQNTSGFGTQDKPPMVLTYTAAGEHGVPFTQGLAYSTDGKTFEKFDKNPIVPRIFGDNRDPRIFWHAPTRQWVMAVWVPVPKPNGERGHRDVIQILNSPDLKTWTQTGQTDGYFECPDLFPLALDGDANRTKWVLTAASGDFQVGEFDGKQFTPQTPMLKGWWTNAVYAAQTFNDIPASDGRRIQVGWFRSNYAGKTFHNSMTVPLELTLVSTPDGPRVRRVPARELEKLRGKTWNATVATEGTATNHSPLDLGDTDAYEVKATITPAKTGVTAFTFGEVVVRFDAGKNAWLFGDQTIPAMSNGDQHLQALVDRGSVELFLNDGLAYVPVAVKPRGKSTVSVDVDQSAGSQTVSLLAYELKSIW